MYKTSKWQLQAVMDKAKLFNCDIKTFVIDADAVYHAKWSARGVDVKLEVTKDEMDYLKLNYWEKPHLTMYLTVSTRYQQYLVVAVWGAESTLQSIKDKLLKQEEIKDDVRDKG